MVGADGVLKIIDLGFGKKIDRSADFDKSISLNWWCEPPLEFETERYDFCTEVYFVGKLFQRIVRDCELAHFRYMDTLVAMCDRDPESRIEGFSVIDQTISTERFAELDFGQQDLNAYREFSDALCHHITKIEKGAKYLKDIQKLRAQLTDVYQNTMLENTIPDAAMVLRCVVEGMYYYRKKGFGVDTVRDFLNLLRAAHGERARVILANLHTRLDSLPRYSPDILTEDDIPF